MEVSAVEFPLEGFGDGLVVALEAKQAILNVSDRGEVVRGESFPLDDGEVDLDLVEPAGMDWSMNEHEIWEGRPSTPRWFAGVPPGCTGSTRQTRPCTRSRTRPGAPGAGYGRCRRQRENRRGSGGRNAWSPTSRLRRPQRCRKRRSSGTGGAASTTGPIARTMGTSRRRTASTSTPELRRRQQDSIRLEIAPSRTGCEATPLSAKPPLCIRRCRKPASLAKRL